MTDASKLLKLKQTAEELSRRKEQATGRMQELLVQLKRDFGCVSLQDAKKLLKRLQREEKEKWEEFAEKMKQLEETYGHLLGE